jgi:hypothetical protein
VALRQRRKDRGTGTVEAWLWRAVVTSALKVRRARQRMVSISAQHEQDSNDRYHDELPSAAVARSSDDEALA